MRLPWVASAYPEEEQMGTASWEDRGRLYGLLIVLEDRLGGEEAELFDEFIGMGEYGLALEE